MVFRELPLAMRRSIGGWVNHLKAAGLWILIGKEDEERFGNGRTVFLAFCGSK